ncbi:hypothetical protein ABBQ32_004352 [Trebouxia sp. C0010 RCD-2024]
MELITHLNAASATDQQAAYTGNSQDSAAMLASTPSAALFPRVLTSSLLPAQGGVGLVEVPTQIQALKETPKLTRAAAFGPLRFELIVTPTSSALG